MMLHCYYDRQGHLITSIEAWAKKLDDASYRHVAETTLPNGRWVSTVWLGLNHRWDDGPPLIFETIVFHSKAVMSEDDSLRYSTEEDARAGHQRLCDKWHDIPLTDGGPPCPI